MMGSISHSRIRKIRWLFLGFLNVILLCENLNGPALMYHRVSKTELCSEDSCTTYHHSTAESFSGPMPQCSGTVLVLLVVCLCNNTQIPGYSATQSHRTYHTKFRAIHHITNKEERNRSLTGMSWNTRKKKCTAPNPR